LLERFSSGFGTMGSFKGCRLHDDTLEISMEGWIRKHYLLLRIVEASERTRMSKTPGEEKQTESTSDNSGYFNR